MAQGDKLKNIPVADSLFVLDYEQIKNIPSDQTVTYARTVVDFRPQKADQNWVRITARDHLVAYPGELMTQTADLIT